MRWRAAGGRGRVADARRDGMPARFRARGASASRPRAGDGAESDGRDSIAAFPARSPAIRSPAFRFSGLPAWDVCSGTHRLGAVDDEDVGLLGLGGGSHCVSVCERLGELAP